MANAARGTVAEWLTLLGWKVEVRKEGDRFVGSATRRIEATTVRVEAQSASTESLAWRLVELATVELERRSTAPLVARAA